MKGNLMDAKADNPEVNPAFGPEELENLARAFHSGKRMLEEIADAKSKAEHFERAAAVAEAENQNLRRAVKRINSERDHYFRAFTALSAQLDQIASGLVSAIHLARAQAYGGRRPVADLDPKDAEVPPPAFLSRQHERLPIDLEHLAAAISGASN